MGRDEGNGGRDDERPVDDRVEASDAEERADLAETVANDSPPTEPVPTITGLFDMPHVDDGSADDAPASAGSSVPFSNSSQPQTDSVRIIAEMFRGFRRRSATPEQDLQQILGTATQTLPVVSGGKVTPTEPPATAGAIPIVHAPETTDAVDDGTDADADAEETDDAVSDEAVPHEETGAAASEESDSAGGAAATAIAPVAHADAPDELTRVPADDEAESPAATPEETAVTPPDEQRPVTTSYVPRDDGNRTEQALAWLTAESVATGQTPIVSGAAELVPRRRRWLTAIFAPIITAIVLAVAYVVAFAVWPLDNVPPTVAAAEVDPHAGPTAAMPWPSDGQAAVLVEGTDQILTSATDENPETAGPMASLTKVITVMTLLERQPLALGEDGPAYEFGYLDQQEANALRWSNESALDVPIGETLTYYQLLEGILMGSAGNYANKLVDALWEGDRDAYLTDALSWLQSNGIQDTMVVDATGISPDNRSTPTSMVKVSQIALQHPVVAQIVAQDSVELPGAGLVENSNPLMGEDGIVGIKTGHLDEWNVKSYNLTTAKNVDLGGEEPIQVYAAVMGQLDFEAQESVSRDLLDTAALSLQPVDSVTEGTVVATVTTPWGARADIVTDATASLTLWNGEVPELGASYAVEVGDSEGDEVGTATITGALGSDEVALVTTGDLPRPSLEWRLTHPLELLGFTE
ncbi:D-alanyl-D-alanine carboxypeptidase [Microbacterium suaedae]|uniref:D-alanyl-D-alanine carboxypeptidase n=1 Tax=Microbacterium suaedae TaxID=2067813 RepID=UPI000DA1C660|nr:D-alanyl-D-alanine carboxypeptidase [Microbacterium suaedae]